MTSKLKCPFCGAELVPQNDIENTEPIKARRGKPGCPWFMWAFPWEIWQALIDGKKAQDAIQEIKDIVYHALDREFYSELQDDMLNIGRIIASVENMRSEI